MLHKDWAPEGHTRFMELLESDFFTNQAFYHVERRGPIEFGIAADPAVSRAWRGKVIPDDPARAELQPRRGQLSFQSNAPGRRETRLVISDSRTRTAADYGPFERPFGQVLNTEILDKLYDGYGDTSDLIPTLVAHGNAAISEMHEMDRIYRCERQYTALEAEVQNVAIEAQVGEQLSDVQSKSESYLKDQALAGFVHSSGEDSGQLFESNIRAPRADPDGSAAHMHDTVFKALSKTAAESIRVLSGAPDPLTPCLPTPDGATPGSPAVKGLPAELKKAVQSQVKKQIQPDVVCEMKLVAANTGCYGSPKYKDQYITGAEWTDEKGGQYRLRDLDLQQSMDACVADAQCQFIWMSVLDEIAARGWGSRALHECKHRPTPDHNLYEKFCLTAEEKRVTEGASLSYLQARESIVSQIKTRAGTAPFHPRTVKEVFAELDKDGDSQLSPTEMLRLSRVVDKRWGSKQRKKVEMPRPAKQKKNRRQDRFDLSEGDMLRLFDEDRDGAISQAERMVANTFMYKKTEL